MYLRPHARALLECSETCDANTQSHKADRGLTTMTRSLQRLLLYMRVPAANSFRLTRVLHAPLGNGETARDRCRDHNEHHRRGYLSPDSLVYLHRLGH